jgi:hypothetical protein
MVSLDIFNKDPFTTIQLTQAIEKVPFQPTLLGDMNIFDPKPVRTEGIFVEERQGKLTLIQTSPRGTPPPSERVTEERTARYFKTPRLAEGDTIYAHELQNIRAFGEEAELMEVQAEVARRLSGPTGILKNLEYTEENMRLGALQGILLDADGSQIYSFFDEFQIAAPAEIAFDLAAQTPNTLRLIINGIVRGMARASQGAFTPMTRIKALCGDQFYDGLVNHTDVVKTFLNWSAAADIREGTSGGAFQAFPFAGIDWINYRGSDDGATIAVPTDKVKFFPVDAPGVFTKVLSPADRMEFVGALGQPRYVYPIFDTQRNQWWRMEAYAFPLYMCNRPGVLYSGRYEA